MWHRSKLLLHSQHRRLHLQRLQQLLLGCRYLEQLNQLRGGEALLWWQLQDDGLRRCRCKGSQSTRDPRWLSGDRRCRYCWLQQNLLNGNRLLQKLSCGRHIVCAWRDLQREGR